MHLGFLVLQLLVLLLPGYLLACLFKMRQHLYFVSIVFSYFYFIVILTLGREFGWTPSVFGIVYCIPVLLVFFLVAARRGFLLSEDYLQWLPGLVAIVCGFLIYFIWAGNYTELPSDLYQHLTNAQRQLRFWNSGSLGEQLALSDLLQQNGKYWYAMLAGLSWFNGVLLIDAFETAMLVNNLLFVTASYFFALAVFFALDMTQKQRQVAAFFSVFFIVAHMGINVFSYVRYYALAPTMINFIVYFAGVLAFCQILHKRNLNKAIVFFCASILVAAMVHTQEALFIFIIALIIFLLVMLQRTLDVSLSIFSRFCLPGFTFCLLFIFVGGFWWFAAVTLPRAPQPDFLLTKIIDSVPVVGHLLVLNPENQLIKVLTIWGVFVYLVFFLILPLFKDVPFLLAGMLSPLFTVLNPFFVDLFLRFDSALTVWRLLYLVPLHFVAGASVVLLSSKIFKTRLNGKLVNAALILLLFVTLLPSIAGWEINRYAKITLAPVEDDLSYQNWRDVIEYLNSQPNVKNIVTDPVTGYMIRALTHHYVPGWKFYNQNNLLVKQTESSLPGLMQQQKGNWLVLNRRSGGFSEVGALAHHWDGEILYFDRMIAPDVTAKLEQFEMNVLFEKNGVKVFEL